MWEPVEREQILRDIDFCENFLHNSPERLRFWEYIRITPEKWIEKTMGDLGGGFWVVAILGKSVIYYNDIEEGFNMSSFTNYGEIDEYSSAQLELHEMIESLFTEFQN
jgi:hypothetical protein